MAYFKEFPKLLYSTSLGIKNFKTITNIFANVRFIKEVLLNSDIYYFYDVKDGERPEDIASKLYKDPEKHWIVLLANGVIDPQYDWVMGQQQFDEYIKKKYSSVNLQLANTDLYVSNYILGETVYQGDSLDDASLTAQVAAFNSATKVLQIKFPSQTIANGESITGVNSSESHEILSMTMNDDGYHWAVNTTSHYTVTETRYNSFDKVKNTIHYNVSTLDFNNQNNTVAGRPLGVTNTATPLVDGTTLYIDTFIGPKSYYDFEVEANEAKRKIKLPKPEFTQVIENQFKRLMRNI